VIAVRSQDDKIADHEAIMTLLAGTPRTQNGRTAIRYPEHNSPEEKRGRAALAREVSEKIPGYVGQLLALAIDPRAPTKIPGMKATRHIHFKSPARGHGSTWHRDLGIVAFIREYKKEHTWRPTPSSAMRPPKWASVVAAAADHFGLKRSSVEKIWTDHHRNSRRDLERLGLIKP
jgi:hypothetical protein